MKGADLIGEFLERIDATAVFGVSGANCEDVFQSIHQKGKSKIILAKSEYGAAAMALGHYLAHKKTGVIITTSGPGVLNTIPVLAEAYTSRIPVILIAGSVPLSLEGKGAFQDTSGKEGTLALEKMLESCTCFQKKIEDETNFYEELLKAHEFARKHRRPAVIILPRDMAQKEIQQSTTFLKKTEAGGFRQEELNRAIYFCEKATASIPHPLIVLGDDCLHLKNTQALMTFIENLDAVVAVTPNAKGLFDHSSKRFTGLTGIMGHAGARNAFKNADHILFIGFPFNALNMIGHEEHLEGKNTLSLTYDSAGDLDEILTALNSFSFNENKRTLPEGGELSETSGFSLENIIEEIQSALAKDSNIFVDAGNTGAYVVHHFKCTGHGLFSISLGMGGMGNSVGAGIGAAALKTRRSVVFLGDGSFFVQGMEVHTALQYSLPVTFFILNNNAHGMCATRENLFLKGETGINRFKASFFASGILKMFPGIPAREINSIEELQECLQDFKSARGPVVVSINISNTENPPFLTFKKPIL